MLLLYAKVTFYHIYVVNMRGKSGGRRFIACKMVAMTESEKGDEFCQREVLRKKKICAWNLGIEGVFLTKHPVALQDKTSI